MDGQMETVSSSQMTILEANGVRYGLRSRLSGRIGSMNWAAACRAKSDTFHLPQKRVGNHSREHQLPTMPPRARNHMQKCQELKRRQEKLRKRSASLFHKAEELAMMTDAWVALVVRDKTGRIRSLRASNDPNWPPSSRDFTVGPRSL
jgi:hypothetical protein